MVYQVGSGSETAGATAPSGCCLFIVSLLLGRLADADCLAALVNLAVWAAVYVLGALSDSSRSLSIRGVLVVTLHVLLHGLLADAVVSEVVELLKLIGELPLLHLFVDFSDEVSEGLLHVACVEGARLEEPDLCCHHRRHHGLATVRTFRSCTYLVVRRRTVLPPCSPVSSAPSRSCCRRGLLLLSRLRGRALPAATYLSIRKWPVVRYRTLKGLRLLGGSRCS